MSADPYASPRTRLAPQVSASLAGPMGALLALMATMWLLIVVLAARVDALAFALEGLLALLLLSTGLFRCVQHRRGQAVCYALATVSIVTMFGPARGLGLSALLSATAAMAAAWGPWCCPARTRPQQCR